MWRAETRTIFSRAVCPDDALCGWHNFRWLLDRSNTTFDVFSMCNYMTSTWSEWSIEGAQLRLTHTVQYIPGAWYGMGPSFLMVSTRWAGFVWTHVVVVVVFEHVSWLMVFCFLSRMRDRRALCFWCGHSENIKKRRCGKGNHPGEAFECAERKGRATQTIYTI